MASSAKLRAGTLAHIPFYKFIRTVPLGFNADLYLKDWISDESRRILSKSRIAQRKKYKNRLECRTSKKTFIVPNTRHNTCSILIILSVLAKARCPFSRPRQVSVSYTNDVTRFLSYSSRKSQADATLNNALSEFSTRHAIRRQGFLHALSLFYAKFFLPSRRVSD